MTMQVERAAFVLEANAAALVAEGIAQQADSVRTPAVENAVAGEQPSAPAAEVAEPLTYEMGQKAPESTPRRKPPKVRVGSALSQAGFLVGMGDATAVTGNLQITKVVVGVGIALAGLRTVFRGFEDKDRRDATRKVQQLVGERFEVVKSDQDKAILRWHPTEGQNPVEGIRRTVAWAANSDGVADLVLPAAQIRKMFPDKDFDGVSWTAHIKSAYPEIRRRKGSGDEVLIADPAHWAKIFGIEQTKRAARHEWERVPMSAAIIEKMREIDPENRFVVAYDACIGGAKEHKELMRQMTRAELQRGLDKLEVRRVDRLSAARERVDIFGTISKDPLQITWNDPVSGPYKEPVAQYMGVDPEKYDIYSALSYDTDELSEQETLNLLTYHLYATTHQVKEAARYDRITHIVDVKKPPVMPNKSAALEPPLVSASERSYVRRVDQLRKRLAIFAISAAMGAGVGGVLDGAAYLLKGHEPVTEQLVGSTGAGPSVGNYTDWSLQPHGMSTAGHWTQMTSNTLSPDGTWEPDFAYNTRNFPVYQPSTVLPSGFPDYIKVTDEQPTLSDVIVGADPHNSQNDVLFVPVQNGTVIAAANVNGQPVETYTTGSYAEALVIPGSTSKGAKLTYWLVPQKYYDAPGTDGPIKVPGVVDSQNIQDMWAQHGVSSKLDAAAFSGILAQHINETGHYTLTPSTLLAKPGQQWSKLLAQWVDGGEEANCEVASTAEVISNPWDNIAVGYLNDNKDNYLAAHELHQWAVGGGGQVYDAAPSKKDAAAKAYFAQAPTKWRVVDSVAARARDFLKDPAVIDGATDAGGVALVGLGALLYHRRQRIATRWRANADRRERQKLWRQLGAQEKRVSKLPEHAQRAGYLLLNEAKYNPHRASNLKDVRRRSRKEDAVPEKWREWLGGRYDLTDDNTSQGLDKASRHARGAHDKRTINAARQIMRLAELRQRSTGGAPRRELIDA